MFALAQNSTLQIHEPDIEGVYRVVANCGLYDEVILVKIQLAKADQANVTTPSTVPENLEPIRQPSHLHFVHRDFLQSLSETGRLQAINLMNDKKSLLAINGIGMSSADLKTFEERKRVMATFLDSRQLTNTLYERRSLGRLVSQASAKHACSRVTVYRYWKLLCQYGFEAESLISRFDQCGAPGRLRPVNAHRMKAGRKTTAERLGSVEENPQPGVDELWRAKVLAADARIPSPKPDFPSRYRSIIKAFALDYTHTPNGLRPVLPPLGSYPNKDQVRHILKSIPFLKQLHDRTTLGHFNRNLRGLVGKSWEGVAGPGHTYAIDSTIGDIYLRSAVNRAWIIGRPIVYIVVDVWSTAIVGFHVCLTGPSWETAKVALFSTFANPQMMGTLWGYDPLLRSLAPDPGGPYTFLCDRGEYLSVGAKETGSSLGVNFSYAAAYRPDWKGVVEVLHRIAKDKQYFFSPGAIDARRKELELRPDASTSALTVREYAQYLAHIFSLYNLTTDRRHRLDTTMMTVGVEPTPAGLWRFGFETGIGYRKEFSSDKLIATLLPKREGVLRHDGIWLGQLQYGCELAKAEQWTTLARHQGAVQLPVHYFPGNVARIWMTHPHGSGMLELNLRDDARAPGDLAYDEWLDAQVYSTLSNRQRDHNALRTCMEVMQAMEGLNERAISATKQAEGADSRKRPSTRDARTLEVMNGGGGDAVLPKTNNAIVPESVDQSNVQRDHEYGQLMQKIMGSL